MVCEKCGAVVPDGWPGCLDCGSTVSNAGLPKGAVQGIEADIFPLLASANLSRMRGKYEEAEKKCIELLRRYPHNPNAHSMLGGIYENQGRYADAVTWYQLALELDPTSESDRNRLNQAIQRQATAEQQTSPAREATIAHWWGSSLSNPGRGPWLLTAALAVVCLGLIFHIVASARSAPVHDSASSGSFSQLGAAQGTGETHISTGASTAGATAEEQTLQQSLGRSPRQGVPIYIVDSLMLDPRYRSYAHITISIAPPLTPASGRTAVVQVAGAVAQAAGAAGLNMITLRIKGVMGNAPPSLLFVAETSSAAFNGINPASLSPANAAALFQNAWWNSSVPNS